MAQPSTPEPRTYDELVESKAGAFRRLYTIVCVIILEILQRMAMMDNPALKPLPSTVLARAIAGDSFGLPAPLAATLRLLARELRRWVDAPSQVQPPEDRPDQPRERQPQPRPRASRAPAASIPRAIPISHPIPRQTAYAGLKFFKPHRHSPPTHALNVPVT